MKKQTNITKRALTHSTLSISKTLHKKAKKLALKKNMTITAFAEKALKEALKN